MIHEIIQFPIIGLCIFIISIENKRPLYYSLMYGFLLFPILTYENFIFNLKNYAISKFSDMNHVIFQTSADNRSLLEMQDRYFSEKSYFINGINGTVFANKFREQLSIQSKHDVFVLTDDSYLYNFLEQVPPFYISLYDQSSLESQIHSVQWLELHKPKYLIVNNKSHEFDTVPNIVRTPILYKFAFNNYSYAFSIDNFSVLTKNNSLDHADRNFWNHYNSTVLDLNYLPGLSNPYKFSSISSSYVQDYLIINIEKPISDKATFIYYNFENYKYTIKFRQLKNINNYYINLDRVWFYSKNSNVSNFLSSESSDNILLSKILTTKPILY